MSLSDGLAIYAAILSTMLLVAELYGRWDERRRLIVRVLLNPEIATGTDRLSRLTLLCRNTGPRTITVDVVELGFKDGTKYFQRIARPHEPGSLVRAEVHDGKSAWFDVELPEDFDRPAWQLASATVTDQSGTKWRAALPKQRRFRRDA